MAKNIENFRDELTKLAEVVEILEKSFLSKGDIKVEVSLDDDTFSNLLKTLRYNRHIDMNEFINSLNKKKKKIGFFKIHENLLDIGDYDNYIKVRDKIENK